MALRILLGCDPELFVRHKSTGKIVSAHDLMPGTKLEPYKVEKGAIQVDGLAAEFNIDPAASAEEFTGNILTVMKTLKETIGADHEFALQPTAMFDPGYFKSLPDLVKELGCSPDWNAWTGQVNEKSDSEYSRAAGGHIHIGWGSNMNPNDPTHIEDCRIVTRQLDYYLGMYSLRWDQDTERRKMYGQAGCFRPKPYGVEYRTLSNMWLSTKSLQSWVYNTSVKAVLDLIQEGNRVEDKFGDMCIDAINNSVQWWELGPKHKLLELPLHTGLMNPPKITKSGEKLEITQAQIIEALKNHFNFGSYSAALHEKAAREGNHVSQINVNKSLGFNYYEM